MVVILKKKRKRKREKARERERRLLRERQRRILNRLVHLPEPERDQPMITAGNIHYELGERVGGLSAGGIGAMLLLARKTGLIGDIDHNLHLLKVHLPYHESDHVLTIAFNILAGGLCIEHIELLRNDEVFLNALGTQRIPDPTTAGDFCRRYTESDVLTLMEAINQTRLRVWAQQPPALPSWTSMAPWWQPMPNASRAWTSPTTAPGAIIPWSSRWPTRPSRSSWSIAAATAPRMSRLTSTSTRRSP